MVLIVNLNLSCHNNSSFHKKLFPTGCFSIQIGCQINALMVLSLFPPPPFKCSCIHIYVLNRSAVFNCHTYHSSHSCHVKLRFCRYLHRKSTFHLWFGVTTYFFLSVIAFMKDIHSQYLGKISLIGYIDTLYGRSNSILT